MMRRELNERDWRLLGELRLLFGKTVAELTRELGVYSHWQVYDTLNKLVARRLADRQLVDSTHREFVYFLSQAGRATLLLRSKGGASPGEIAAQSAEATQDSGDARNSISALAQPSLPSP